MRRVICPGSFDPVTYGHLDIIGRATLLFDELVVAVSVNPMKKPLFSIDERIEMLSDALSPYPNVVISKFYGLTVNFALEQNAKAIVRGLRVMSDFENEFRMALTNKKLACHIETVFLMTKDEYSFISSSTVREVAFFGGSVRNLVPPMVEERLKAKFKTCATGKEG